MYVDMIDKILRLIDVWTIHFLTCVSAILLVMPQAEGVGALSSSPNGLSDGQ